MDVMRVIKPPLSSTIQDEGRSIGMAQGVPPSGSCDLFSYRLNNLVLGNPPGSGVLEIAAQGGDIELLADCVIAVTGAELSFTLQGKCLPLGEPVYARKGDLLSAGSCRRGTYAYLGISGGIDGSIALGSRSTYTVGMLGGLEGRRLASGDVLTRDRDPEPLLPIAGAGDLAREMSEPPKEIRIVPGPQEKYFDSESYETLVRDYFRVSNRSDRMAFRLLGPAPVCAEVPRTADTGSGPTDIVEEGNPVGGIQVAGGAELICLGRDCGTSGGYAKIGTVIEPDLSRMAQLVPNDQFTFELVDVGAAAAARAAAERQLEDVASLGEMNGHLGTGFTALVGAAWSDSAGPTNAARPAHDRPNS